MCIRDSAALRFLSHHEDDDLLREMLAFGKRLRCPRAWLLDVLRHCVLIDAGEAAHVHAYLAAEHLGAEPDLRDPHLLRSLARLADLRLLERASPFDDLAHPKFTCLLDAEPAHDLADTIRLPLGRYIAQ